MAGKLEFHLVGKRHGRADVSCGKQNVYSRQHVGSVQRRVPENESVSSGYDIWVAAQNYQNYGVGDWGYFEDGSWVTNWSIDFNSKVRYGTMTVTSFSEKHSQSAANATNAMLTRIVRK